MSAARKASTTTCLRRLAAAWPLLLSVAGAGAFAQTTPMAARATPASALVSRPATAAVPSPSPRSGAESSLIELQSQVSQRAMMGQVTPGLLGSTNESSKAVAGNIGRGGGAPPACRLCKAKAKQP